MNKILKITFFCIIALAIGISLGNISDLTKINASLNGQLQQQEQTYSGRIDELSAYQETLVERISLLEENYSKLQTAYDELKTAYDKYIQDSTLEREQIQATVVALKGTIATLENNADVDKATISNLRTQVRTLESSLENQTTTANQLRATINQQETTITELNTRIDELIADLNSDLMHLDFYKGLIEGTVTEITAEDLAGVTRIRPYAFEDSYNLRSIEFPESLEFIGEYAFCRLGLRSLDFSNCQNLTTIEQNAFRDCHIADISNLPYSLECVSLASFSGTNWYTRLPDNEFVYLESFLLGYKGSSSSKADITSYEIIDGTTHIGGNAFYNFSSLTTVKIPTSVKKLCDDAFSNTGLVTFVIPDTIEYVGDSCFFGCSLLKSIILSNSMEKICHRTFYGCRSLTSLIIPNAVKYISGGFLQNCDNLKSITIPASVEKVHFNAFYNCSISTVTFLATTPPEFAGGFTELSECPNITTVYIPAGTLEIYRASPGWVNFYDVLVELPA